MFDCHLQDKAQVFPLEAHDGVRTRLTHSLDVSSVARGLATRSAKWLLDQGEISTGMDRAAFPGPSGDGSSDNFTLAAYELRTSQAVVNHRIASARVFVEEDERNSPYLASEAICVKTREASGATEPARRER